MESFSAVTGLLIGCFSLISAWPLDFQQNYEYENLRQPEPQFLNVDDENPVDLVDPNIRSEIWDWPKHTLPRTRFEIIKDLSNGGAGAFEFKKPTGPVVKPRATGNIHIPTISDETPLYLNYAEKDDATRHLPALFASLTEKTTSTPVAEKFVENQENSGIDETDNENKKFDPSILTLPEYVQEDREPSALQPEIDYTQRLTIPEANQQDHEEDSKITDEELAYPLSEPSQNDAVNVEEEPNEEISSDTPAASTVIPVEERTPEIISVIAPAPAPPHHLQEPSALHFAPASHLDFFFGSGASKRSGKNEDSSTTTLLIPIVAACACAAIVGTVAAALVYKRSHRKKPYTDIEDPSYGVTGPPTKPTFLDLSGDRSLAKSAETYHYQHQKQKILSSVDNNPSSGGSTEPKSGDHSDYDTEDDDEAEDYGDYTVYECPGLAPPGDLEVVNPMFTTLKKDDSAEE